MQALPSIPGYQLLASLGGGPMTVVSVARDLQTDQLRAIKTVRPDWEDLATAVTLLQCEARAGLGVQNPHLVRILAAQVTGPPYYLVMELLSGESLRCRLRRDYCLDPPDAIWIARQTTEAIAALHQAGLMHGDVKPDNLKLLDAGSVVLIDLGFARQPGENAVLLRQGYVLGTANYLAPELCDERPSEGLASDLFSLGVTLFEMLTGQLPYPPGSLSQTFRRHRCDPPADLRRLGPLLPGSLVDLVESLLQRHPDRRPPIATVLHQLIDLEIAAFRWARSA
jgi:serine/threonine protein kinase